jgi:hypothetical protein
MRPLETTVGPFANLPEPKNARRGIALTAEVMKQWQWVKPELVARIGFAEWTDEDHLRHARFLGLRDNHKDPGEDERIGGYVIVDPLHSAELISVPYGEDSRRHGLVDR